MEWHQWKKPILHGEGRYLAWTSKGHTGIPLVPLACHLWEALLLTKEGASKIPSSHLAIVHQSRGSPVVKVSLVWEEHYWIGFWKPTVGHQHYADCRWIIICDRWQPGGASVEELLSQLPEDVIGSGLNKEDPGRTPPATLTPFCIPSAGRACHQAPAARSLWSKCVCCLWSSEGLNCDLVGQDTL
jgi:hypothetical protein